MFLTVEIRGCARLVRQRQGEEVSDPIADFEDGSEPDRPVVVGLFDLGRMVREGYAQRILETRGERLPDPRVVSGASATFTGGGGEQREDGEPDLRDRPKRPHERLGVPDQGELLRMALERPRRLLRRLYAESRRRGPLTLRFVRPLESGRALVDVTVDGPKFAALGRLELGVGDAHPAALHLSIEAELRPTGDLEGVCVHWQTLGPTGDAPVLARLGRVVSRLCRRPGRREVVTRLLRTWLHAQPGWAVAVAEQLLLRPTALPRVPSPAQTDRARGGPTLADILEGVEVGASDERAPPSLRWRDDRRADVWLEGRRTDREADLELAALMTGAAALLDALGPSPAPQSVTDR